MASFLMKSFSLCAVPMVSRGADGGVRRASEQGLEVGGGRYESSVCRWWGGCGWDPARSRTPGGDLGKGGGGQCHRRPAPPWAPCPSLGQRGTPNPTIAHVRECYHNYHPTGTKLPFSYPPPNQALPYKHPVISWTKQILRWARTPTGLGAGRTSQH